MSENNSFQDKKFSSKLGKSRSKSVSDLIIIALHEGKWLPGARLNDEEIAQELQVSRITVREALTSLVGKRVVEKRHWKGYYLKNFEPDEIRSMIEVRLVLEKYALVKFIEKGNTNKNLLLEMNNTILASEMCLGHEDYYKFMDTDFHFHELIYQGSDSIWISIIIEDLRINIDILRSLSMKNDFKQAAKASIQDHRELLNEMIKGDIGKATEILEKHFSLHLKNILFTEQVQKC